MKKLKKLLKKHEMRHWSGEILGCMCGWEIDAYNTDYHAHLAEMLKPLLAEAWHEGA